MQSISAVWEPLGNSLSDAALSGDAPVSHSGGMPTQRRRSNITETPPVQAALDDLRRELGHERLDLGELLILGATAKLARLRAERIESAARRASLADRIRRREARADRSAADEVRRAGWART